MQTWTEAYRRLRTQGQFVSWFGKKGRTPGPNDFAYRAVGLYFDKVTGFEEENDPFGAPLFGPLTIIFDAGAVILGITSGAYQEQQEDNGQLPVPPSSTPGRRDTFVLSLAYTDGEYITVPQSTMDPVNGALLNQDPIMMADPLMGEGQKTESPRMLLIAPSTGLSVVCKSLQPALDSTDNIVPPLGVQVVVHCVVPIGC